MAGNVGWFDVTDLMVDDPIIEPGTDFHLEITFDGTGPNWSALEAAGHGYTCTFYVERLGGWVPGLGSEERTLGTVTGNLSTGGGPYTESLTTAPDLSHGVYRIMGIVQLDAPWDHVVGFYEGDVLGQVREDLP